MISRRLSLISLAALLISSGIPSAFGMVVSYSMDLYNNTEYPIELLNAGSGSTWAVIIPGRSKRIPYAKGVTIRVAGGRQLRFDPIDPPGDFARKGLLSLTLKGQFNTDFRIWLLPPSSDWQAFKMPAQPPGFPLSSSR